MIDVPQPPMLFDISMGVRKDELALKRKVDAALTRRSAGIRAILESFGVPLVDQP